MRDAIGTIPFLLAMAALPAAGQLPASCGAVGAKSYTPPAVTIPAVVLNRGTLITVTNATGVVNGDTSSVKALMANPGPDGISLVEAITATNNDPGTWNIQFAPALTGSTISGSMPYLGGGNVTVNGDIDGDGQPDITVTSTVLYHFRRQYRQWPRVPERSLCRDPASLVEIPTPRGHREDVLQYHHQQPGDDGYPK